MMKKMNLIVRILATLMLGLGTPASVFADAPLFWPSERGFTSNAGYEAGTKPALFDLDGDGDLDVAVGFNNEMVFRIFENVGDGTFLVAGEYSTVGNLRDTKIAAADLDGDGDADLAVGTRDGVEVFINQGNWDFTAGESYAAGGWVLTGDVDNDGDVDLVTDGIYVLKNNGDATFVVSEEYTEVGDFTVTDLNGDGYLDIATSGSWRWTNPIDGSLLVNDGSGSFTNVGSIGAAGYTIGSGDFNGDGHMDLAVSARVNTHILLNDGTGTFTDNDQVPTWYADDMAVDDFDGDGTADLAIYANQDVYVNLNNGDGTFEFSIEGWFGCGSAYIESGDVDGDGDSDIVLIESNGCGELGIIMNNGDGTFADALAYTDEELGSDPYTVTVGDFNDDGLNDMAVGVRNREVIILFNVDGSSFDVGPAYDVSGYSDITAADFDGDGDIDLATNGVDVLLNDGTGVFEYSEYYPINGEYVEAADMDMDGDMDLVTSEVEVLLNDGNGNFGEAIAYPNAYGDEFTVGDFNGDGFPDVAGTSDYRTLTNGRWVTIYTIVVSFNDGEGGFLPGTEYDVAIWDWSAGLRDEIFGIAVGDVDNDGDVDIATALKYEDLESGGEGTKLRILENDGTGAFTNQETYDMLLGEYATAYGIDSGDFNGDGYVDFVLVTCYHTVVIALNNGDGTFYPGGYYSGVCGDHRGDEVETGDLNMDGKSDIMLFDRRMDVLLSSSGEGDKNKGHGNDADGVDEGNPGRGCDNKNMNGNMNRC